MMFVSLLLSVVLAFIVGSNDVIGSLGITYGSRVLSMRKTLFLMCVCNLIGICLFGPMIINVVGEGIAEIMDPLPIVVSAIAIAIAVLYFRIPASVTQIVLGSIVGYALANNLTVFWGNFVSILVAIIISPVIAIFLAGNSYLLYVRYVMIRGMGIERRIMIRKTFSYLQIIVGCLTAVALGAIEVGVVMGFNLGFENVGILQLAGAAGILLGIVVWGRKIMRHVTRGFVSLTPEKGFIAQLAGLITILIFFYNAIPVSVSMIITGSIIGIGRISGKMNRKILFDTFALWIFVVPGSVILGFVLGTLI